MKLCNLTCTVLYMYMYSRCTSTCVFWVGNQSFVMYMYNYVNVQLYMYLNEVGIICDSDNTGPVRLRISLRTSSNSVS